MKNWMLVPAIVMAIAPLFVTRCTAQDEPAIQHSQGEKPKGRHADALSRSSRIGPKTLSRANSNALMMNRGGLKPNPGPNFSSTPLKVQRSGRGQSPHANFATTPSSRNVRHRGSNQPAIAGTGNLILRNTVVNGTEIHKRR